MEAKAEEYPRPRRRMSFNPRRKAAGEFNPRQGTATRRIWLCRRLRNFTGVNERS